MDSNTFWAETVFNGMISIIMTLFVYDLLKKYVAKTYTLLYNNLTKRYCALKMFSQRKVLRATYFTAVIASYGFFTKKLPLHIFFPVDTFIFSLLFPLWSVLTFAIIFFLFSEILGFLLDILKFAFYTFVEVFISFKEEKGNPFIVFAEHTAILILLCVLCFWAFF